MWRSWSGLVVCGLEGSWMSFQSLRHDVEDDSQKLLPHLASVSCILLQTESARNKPPQFIVVFFFVMLQKTSFLKLRDALSMSNCRIIKSCWKKAHCQCSCHAVTLSDWAFCEEEKFLKWFFEKTSPVSLSSSVFAVSFGNARRGWGGVRDQVDEEKKTSEGEHNVESE